MGDEFKIKVGQFEGPLELLLDLVEKRKLHISEVSLSQVTDEYIAHVKAMQEFNIPDTAHFILVASTLLLIKSRSLLPNLSLSSEEEADIKDLEERLRIYERVRGLSRHVKECFGKSMIFPRGERKMTEIVFSPDPGITLYSVCAALRGAILGIPIKNIVPETIVRKVISLEDMIVKLVDRVQNNLRLSFKEFAKGSTEKVEIIVSFLAMLELVKQGAIDVVQENHFEDIHMEAQSVGTPRYE